MLTMNKTVCGLAVWVAVLAVGAGAAEARTPQQAARDVGGSVARAAAAVARWVPGNPYMVTEDDANSFLERNLDHVYCTGIPRFGHRGEFPYEEFVYFDCAVSHDGGYCSGWRVRAVKGKAPGFFRMVVVRRGRC
jgi:hypothetical protein